MQQAYEDVKDAQIQAVRRHNIVGFTAVHDGPDLHQDHRAHQHNNAARNHDGHQRQLQKDVRNDANHHNHEADSNEAAHEREVALTGHGIASKPQKDDCRAAQCSADHLRAIRQGEVDADDRTESESEQTRDTRKMTPNPAPELAVRGRTNMPNTMEPSKQIMYAPWGTPITMERPAMMALKPNVADNSRYVFFSTLLVSRVERLPTDA